MPKPAAEKAKATTRPTARSEHEQDVINRLRRIEGQVRAVMLMIESGRSCEDIAQQMAAARKAMDKAFYRMMACSMLDSLGQEGGADSIERSTRILEKYA